MTIPHRGGLPHSDTHGSTPARGSPWLFAACHVLLRLLVPRHPPNALLILDPFVQGRSPGTSPCTETILKPQPSQRCHRPSQIMRTASTQQIISLSTVQDPAPPCLQTTRHARLMKHFMRQAARCSWQGPTGPYTHASEHSPPNHWERPAYTRQPPVRHAAKQRDLSEPTSRE